MARDYGVHFNIATVTTALTLAQIKAGATTPLQIVHYRVGGTAGTNYNVSNGAELQLVRKSAAATVTSFTPLVYGETAGTPQIAQAVGSTTGTGVNGAAASGTDGDIIHRVDVNFQAGAGYEYIWVPGMPEIWVKATGIIALELGTAPATVTISGHIAFREFA